MPTSDERLYNLIKEIEKRPELFIGCREIRALRHLLCGYLLALREEEPERCDWLFCGFQRFLARKYKDGDSRDWAGMIAVHEEDGGSTDAFFRLYHEYLDAPETLLPFQRSPAMIDLMETIRADVSSRGFRHGSTANNRFFRQEEGIIFAMNVQEEKTALRVEYGCTFPSKMAGYEETLQQIGISDAECALRFARRVANAEEWRDCLENAQACFDRWRDMRKEAIQSQAKAMRKDLMQTVTDKLKPLGFKKSGNKWTLACHEWLKICVYADKTPYADEYSFEAYVASSDADSGFCTRYAIFPEDGCFWDWQIGSWDELNAALDRCIRDFIRPFLDTELAELGRQASLQSACSCDRTRCERCWLEKNLWGLREANARSDSSGTR